MAAALLISPSSTPNSVTGTKTLFFGDSITLGEGLLPPEQERWTALVSAAQGWGEINEGKGGRPSSAWDDFEAVLNAHKHDPHIGCFVVALGGNDSRDPAPDIAEQVGRNVSRMIQSVRQEAPAWTVVVGGTYNINRLQLQRKEIADLRERNLIAIDATLRSMAQEKGCTFVSFLGALPPETLIADGIHPDCTGHADLASVFLASWSLPSSRKP